MNLRPRSPRDRVAPLDLTSLVDVVFILIIFFLTTSSLIDTLRAEIDLPLESGNEQAPDRPTTLVVNIDRSGAYIVENRELTIGPLRRMIEAEIDKAGSPRALDLLVRPDRDASLAPVNDLASTLVDLGATRWRIATEIPPPPR